MKRALVCLLPLVTATPLHAQTPPDQTPAEAGREAAAECRRLTDTPPDVQSFDDFVKLAKHTLEACRRANAAVLDDLSIKVAFAQALRGDGQLEPALALLRSAADAGSIEALYPLVDIHLSVDRSDVKKRPLVTRAEAEAALRKAAQAGQSDAMLQLALLSERGGVVRRDPAAARFWAERAAANPPKMLGPSGAQAILGRLLLASDSPADRTRGFDLLERLAAENNTFARTDLARGLRDIADRRDLARARTLLEQSLAERDTLAAAPLAEMLINGEGGPKDVQRGLGLLRNRPYEHDAMVRYVLGKLLLEGKVLRRDPQAATVLLTDRGIRHFETRLEAMRLLATYTNARVRSPGPFLYAATEAADLDEPGAAAALMALKFSGNSQFRDEVGGYELARIAARKGDDVAAVRVLEYDTMLARSGASPEELERIRSELARLTGKDIAQAFTLQGKLLRTGGILPQDDVAATRVIIRGAELGDVEAMLLAAKAYDDGLGVPKDVRQQVRWLREAAKRGSVEARRGLIWQSSFDSARQITLRESVTERVALYNEQLGNVSTTDFSGGFSGMRMREYTPRRIATAMMDGFRLAPAGLADERLVPLMRQMPQELRAEIEKVLKEEGFYPSGTEGYFGPEARAALGAWADAKGPLTDETPSSGAPQQQQSAALGQPSAPGGAKPADAMPSVPADVLEAYWTRTRETFKAAKTDAQKREVVRMLALLARAGDMSARWLIVRDYDDSRLIRAAVTPVEAVRWGIDVLLTKPPFAEKASIEFAFLAANLGMSRQMAAFGEAFMIAARDDPRLAEDGMLAGLTHDMIFVGGACESIGNQLRKLKAPAYDGRDECGPSMREAIQAVVKAQGPAGVERAPRMAAVKELTQPEEAKAQPRKRR